MPPTEHWLPSLILQSTSATLPISKQSSYPQYHGANSKMLLHQMNYTHLVLKKQIKFFFLGGGGGGIQFIKYSGICDHVYTGTK